MTCTMILFGTDAKNRTPVKLINSSLAMVVQACSPKCEVTTSVGVVANSLVQGGFEVTRVADWPGKPVETYVLEFPNGEAAMAWIRSAPEQFVDKQILLIDPTC